MLSNKKYLLKGLICCPFSGCCNTILINLSKDLHLLKKGLNYFYDDSQNNNQIIKIENNWRNLLNNNLPFILIYQKE